MKIFLIFIFQCILFAQCIGQSNQKRKVIIDCDPGIDDAMALVYALQSPKLDVIGITTVFGNTPTELSTKNALLVSELVGKEVPVYEGVLKPLVIATHNPSDYVHGSDGLGNTNLPQPKGSKQNKNAVQYIIDACRKYPGEITIVTLGPLTNLALAYKLAPDIASLVKEVVIMGGAVYVPGNMSPVAEANIYIDPHAADVVFSGSWEISVVGLDITSKVIVNSSNFNEIKKNKPDQGDFLTKISSFYTKFYKSVGVEGGFQFHDPSILIYLTHPNLFETITGAIIVQTDGVARGQTILNTRSRDSTMETLWGQRSNVRYATKTDSRKLINIFCQTIINGN